MINLSFFYLKMQTLTEDYIEGYSKIQKNDNFELKEIYLIKIDGYDSFYTILIDGYVDINCINVYVKIISSNGTFLLDEHSKFMLNLNTKIMVNLFNTYPTKITIFEKENILEQSFQNKLSI